MAYKGSIDLISGIRQKNGGTYPLVHASAVQVGENPDDRLDAHIQGSMNDTALTNMTLAGMADAMGYPYVPVLWEQGLINTTTGQSSPNTQSTRIRTIQYIPVNRGIRVELTPGYRIIVYRYAESYEFIDTYPLYVSREIDANGAAYIRIVAYLKYGGDIAPKDATGNVTLAYADAALVTDTLRNQMENMVIDSAEQPENPDNKIWWNSEDTVRHVLAEKSDVDKLAAGMLRQNIIPITAAGTTEHNGVTYISDGHGQYVIEGEMTAATEYDLYNSTSRLPDGFRAGETYFLRIDPQNTAVSLSIRFYNGAWSSYRYFTKDARFTIPEDAAGMRIVFRKLFSGTKVFPKVTVKPEIYAVDSLGYALERDRYTDPRRPMMLTIIDDDGNPTYYTDLLPICRQKHISISTAVVVENVGTRAMSWAQIAEVMEAGCEVLSHGYHHWSGITESDTPMVEIETDYRKAKNLLAMHGVYNNIHVFNGSTGRYPNFVTACKHVFKCAFRPDGQRIIGLEDDATLPYCIPRYAIEPDTTTDDTRRMIDTLVTQGHGWMVVKIHTSDANWVSSGDGSTTQKIVDCIDYAQAHGIQIVTAECGLRAYLGI